MGFEERFKSIWFQQREIDVQPLPENKCVFAQSFSQWVMGLFKCLEDPSIVAVNQAKVLLQDKYFEYYRYVSKKHRKHRSPRGHICIFQVYEAAYDQLKVIELQITPPMMFVPEEKPIEPPPPRIAGIFMGEVIDMDDE